ncbi:MAG: TetR/AcrR family transcriptional regulator [Bacteroidota bacterium]
MNKRRNLTPEGRKLQILAAAELVLLEVGIENFTVDQVIEKAGIAKGTVYNYYKNKDEMLGAVGLKALSMLHQKFSDYAGKHENSLEKIKAVCLASYEYNHDFPRYFDLISYMERPEFDITDADYMKMSHKLQILMVEIVEEGKKKGEIRKHFDPMAINYIVWASCVGVIQFLEAKKKLLTHYHEMNTKQLIETYANMITDGLAA